MSLPPDHSPPLIREREREKEGRKAYIVRKNAGGEGRRTKGSHLGGRGRELINGRTCKNFQTIHVADRIRDRPVQPRIVGQLERLQTRKLANGVGNGPFQTSLGQGDGYDIWASAVYDQFVEGVATAGIGAVVAALPLHSIFMQSVIERLERVTLLDGEER